MIDSEWLDRMFLTGVETTFARHAYIKIRSVLEAWYENESRTQAGRILPREQLKIRVRLASGMRWTDSELRFYLEIASQQRLRELDASQLLQHQEWKSLFKLTDVDVAAKSVGPRMVLLLTQIVKCGINIEQVSLLEADVDDASAALYVNSLQTLLMTCNAMNSQGSVTSLKIPATLSLRTATAIFSALTYSQSLRYVEVNVEPDLLEDGDPDVPFNDDERTYAWKWIAVSVFSSDARHRLDSVRLHVGELRGHHVNAMCQVLDSTEPLADSYGVRGQNCESIRFVTASRFLLRSAEDDRRLIKVTVPMQDVRVLEDLEDSEYLTVMLPGWGRALVQRDHASESIKSSLPQSKEPFISTLLLFHVNDNSKAHVLKLLTRVGKRITRLVVVSRMRECIDAWIRSVLELCPNLEELRIGGSAVPLHSLESMSECYERGVCHVKRLSMMVRVEDKDNAFKFFQKLSNPDHSMTQSLRRVDVSFNHLAHPLFRIQRTVEAMLLSNRLLEDISLTFNFRSIDDEDLLCAIESLNDVPPIPIAARFLPLALTSKLAFLSATMSIRSVHSSDNADDLETHTDLIPDQPLSRLDRAVVSLIFQFAAECRQRKVFVFVSNRFPTFHEDE